MSVTVGDLLLEELGVAYEPVPVDPRKGEQFASDYLAVNPNAKVPAIIDGGAIVFDSNDPALSR